MPCCTQAFKDALDVVHAGAMAGEAGQAALLRPASVAVHDDADVTGDRAAGWDAGRQVDCSIRTPEWQ